MAASDPYDHGHGDLVYAPNDPRIDPVLQLHRPYDEPHPLPSLSAEHTNASDFDQGQAQYPPLDGPDEPNTQSAERDGRFRPHESPRPIIPPDLDTSMVDLTYRRNPRSHSSNNPGPDGWLYPHKKGIGTGSNLEPFKDEIEARTMSGENCKTIAVALQAIGVQTSDKAISRVRIKWGMRKRSQRKIKTPPPDSDAARLTAKTKVQTLRKIEIKRMTEEGMTAEQIYENLTSRGMELKKGVATVLRLQSAWKLTSNPKRWLENFRHQCHKKAKAQQVQAFKDIAKEMILDNFDAWLEAKLAEQQVREARHELAIKMMGEHAPTVNRRKIQARRGEGQVGNEPVDDEEEDWQEDMSNADQGDVSDEGPSPYIGLDGQPSAVFAPMDGHSDVDMMDNGHSADSTADVAMRAFARVDEAMPTQTDVSDPVPPKPVQSKSVSTSRTAAASGLKRGKRRPSKGKQANAKPSSKPEVASMHEAPGGQMIPDEYGVLPDVTLGSPRPQDLQPQAFGSTPSATPAPALVLRPEEAEANRTALSTLDQYKAAAEAYQEVLQARTDNKPIPRSLTGLPPSWKEVAAAKNKLKDITQAMMLDLDFAGSD